MIHRRPIRRLALLPALAWLLVQFAMTGVLVPASTAAVAGPDFGPIVICTAEGLKVIAADGDAGTPSEDPSLSGCKWCQAFGAAATPPPLSDAGLVVRAAGRSDYALASIWTAGSSQGRAGIRGRAPPL